MLFRVNVGVYNKHRRLRSGVHSVRRQKLSDAIKFDVSKHFIPFDGNNAHDVTLVPRKDEGYDVDSYHERLRNDVAFQTALGRRMR